MEHFLLRLDSFTLIVRSASRVGVIAEDTAAFGNGRFLSIDIDQHSHVARTERLVKKEKVVVPDYQSD